MKKVLLLLLINISFTGCEDIAKDDKGIQAESSGNINNLSVIVEKELWNGEIGEAIRNHLAGPVDGLPQEEPLFSLSQMPPESFAGFVRRNRIFLKIEKGPSAKVQVAEDPFAKPQTGIVITGESNAEISELIDENAEKIIAILKETELKERKRRIAKSLADDSRLREELGVSLKFPSAYRYAKDEKGFFWIRRDITNGFLDMLIYEIPLNALDKDTNVIGNIIDLRDSIGEKHIPGRLEGSHMITEAAYAPYLYESEVDGKFAYETRGTWEVNNDFMAGPFVNYAVRDVKNDRYVILEGFMFRPSATKRDYMFELDAILRSAKIE